MSFIEPDREPRTFYLGKGGNNGATGNQSPATLRTVTESESRCAALSPVPSQNEQAAVFSLGRGNYDEAGFPISFPDWTQIFMPVVSFSGLNSSGPSIIDMHSFAKFTCSAVTVSNPSRVGVLFNGAKRSQIESNAIVCTGGEAAVKITGMSEDSFSNVGQIITTTIGYIIDDTTNTPIVIESNILDMVASNAKGWVISSIPETPINISGKSVRSVGAITGTVILEINGGDNIDYNYQRSEGDFIVNAGFATIKNQRHIGDLLINGGGASVTAQTMTGDITVNSGAELDVHINKFDYSAYSVLILGIANGRIGEILYGTWVEGNVISSSGIVKGGIKNNYDNDCLRRTIDTTTDTVDKILCSYFQDKTDANTVGFRVLDADSGLVYWENNTTSFSAIGAQYISIDLAADLVNALPANQVVNLRVQAERVVDNDSDDASCTITFTRIS